MKKIILIIIIAILTTGCGLSVDKKGEGSTTYQLNELATIDHFNITAIESSENNDNNANYLIVNFKIKNNSKSRVVVSSNDFKSYYDGEYINSIDEYELEIPSNEEKVVTVKFKVNGEDNKYKLLFYSNVVSNNIAFEIDNV